MKPKIGQNGSVLLIVVIAGAVAAGLISITMSRFNNAANYASAAALTRENMRVGDALAKVVATSYENAKQAAASGTSCSTYNKVTQGTTQLCFPGAPPTTYDRCTPSKFGGYICLDISSPKVIAKNGIEFIQFGTYREPTRSNAFLSMMFPEANAQAEDRGRPPAPLWATNAFTGISCPGNPGDPAICRECGAGTSNKFICFDVVYCPANVKYPNPCPTSALHTGIMVAR